MSKIRFFSEETSFKFRQKTLVRQWVRETVKNEGYQPGELNFIFCPDDYLLSINRQYLKHDTLTDIVTFSNSEREGTIAGDIFISIDRVRENALRFEVTERDELHRVMVHGILHLCGYLDKKKEDKELMREREDFYLSRRNF